MPATLLRTRTLNVGTTTSSESSKHRRRAKAPNSRSANCAKLSLARVRGLLRLGVKRGDRVAAYLPNITETVIAFLASASIGAVWASCAPEFGPRGVIDRFLQIEPTVLLGVSGYRYGDKSVDRFDTLNELRTALPTVRHLVHVPYGEYEGAPAGAVSWVDLLDTAAEPAYDDVPFDHPLCILFSSGTTGLPKPPVGGTFPAARSSDRAAVFFGLIDLVVPESR